MAASRRRRTATTRRWTILPDWEHEYYGANYARLQTVKREYVLAGMLSGRGVQGIQYETLAPCLTFYESVSLIFRRWAVVRLVAVFYKNVKIKDKNKSFTILHGRVVNSQNILDQYDISMPPCLPSFVSVCLVATQIDRPPLLLLRLPAHVYPRRDITATC